MLVGLVDRCVCEPGSGDVETEMASILDTSGFSIFGGRFKEGKFFLRGDTYESCWKKVWGYGPHVFFGGPGQGWSTTGVQRSPAVRRWDFRACELARMFQERPVSKAIVQRWPDCEADWTSHCNRL